MYPIIVDRRDKKQEAPPPEDKRENESRVNKATPAKSFGCTQTPRQFDWADRSPSAGCSRSRRTGRSNVSPYKSIPSPGTRFRRCLPVSPSSGENPRQLLESPPKSTIVNISPSQSCCAWQTVPAVPAYELVGPGPPVPPKPGTIPPSFPMGPGLLGFPS